MQRAWSVGEIGCIAETLAAVGPSADFAAGVMALAYALNATVRLPLELTAAGDALTLTAGQATDCAAVTVVTSAAMTQGPA